MGTEFKVEVIHRETVRPSFPTPPHLKTLSLSVFDQIMSDFYISILLFYPCHSDTVNGNDIDHNSSFAEKSSLLKASLSETLNHFYPFAGKFQYNDSICCDDHGVEFIEARVNCHVAHILAKPDSGKMEHLFPAVGDSTPAVTGHLLLVQVNFFECGGMAIGINISHKVADGFTFSTFVKSWADMALGYSTTDQIALPVPEFGVTATLWPSLGIFNLPQPVVEYTNNVKCVVKRFVFEASRIDALKSKASCSNVPNPTRVEVVSAHLWKCVSEALRSNTRYARPSVWYQAVNMRKLLGQNSSVMGNLAGLTAAKTEESEANYQSLVAILREDSGKFKTRFGTGISGEAGEVCKEFLKLWQSDDMDTYKSTSWCRFSFYEANFGWGKPSWVADPNIKSVEHLILLLDTKDGRGIEATMSFKEEEMALIEINQELLAYASLDPAVI